MGIDWEKVGAYGGKALSTMGASMDPNPDGVGRQLGEAGADMADSVIMDLLAKKQKEKAEEQRKGKMGGGIGSTLGSIAGMALAPVTGGLSMALASGAGAALGGMAGTALGGGKVDVGDWVQEGLQTGATSFIAPKVMGKVASMAKPGASTVVTKIPGAPTGAQSSAAAAGALDAAASEGASQAVSQAASMGFGDRVAGALYRQIQNQVFDSAMGSMGIGGQNMFTHDPRLDPYYQQAPYYGY